MPHDATPRAGRIPTGLVWVLGLAVVAAGFVIAVGRWKPNPAPTPPDTDPFALTPLSASPYLNTGPDATYIGSDACAGCHKDRHASFRRTGMGRSMARVDPAREPPDATYDHTKSRRRYQIARKDGQLWHRELLLAPGSPEVTLTEHPVDYVVGSGRHSLTYTCEADGFMVESPATWYSSKQAWAMSPGYDRPHHRGFEREIGVQCLTCHAGRVEAVNGTLHQMRVIEPAIGCERCHGPGSLHAARHRDRPPGEALTEADMTIVNPRHLPRELAESVCQQCHLRPTAAVPARGRGWHDFRPGLPLQDFLHTFQSTADNSGMTVTGHVEQLHLSRCYQKSATLTCVTCHDPHGEPRDGEKVAYYRAACQQCHQPAQCKVKPDRRARESPDNDCVKCHMPRSPTDIPHLAFSHHRIGVHDRPATAPGATPAPADELVEFQGLSRFSDLDRRRSLGLGYLEAANREKDPTRADRYRVRALDLLLGVREAGLRDPSVEAGLARITFDRATGGACPPEVRPFAEAALSIPGIRAQDRCMALYFQAAALAGEGRAADALGPARELVRLRRHSADWVLIAECEQALGHTEAWVEALSTATRINPRLWQAHQALAEHYARNRDTARATWHRQRAVR